jgi:hypothetical protein
MSIIFLMMSADVKSTNGVIQFDTTSDSQAEMTLNSAGLGIGTNNPSANLHVVGNAYIQDLVLGNAQEWSRTTISSNSTLGETFSSPIIFVDTSSDNVTLTLPYAGNVSGKTLWIKKKSRSNLLTLQVASGNIDGEEKIFLGSSGKNLPNI